MVDSHGEEIQEGYSEFEVILDIQEYFLLAWLFIYGSNLDDS